MKITNCTSLDAEMMLKAIPNSLLIDVRTEEEWSHGVPKTPLGEDQLFLLTILERSKVDGSMLLNPDFLGSLNAQLKGAKLDLFFICRSGKRSMGACEMVADSDITYSGIYNIVDGFVGSDYGPGWLNSGLPIYKNFRQIY